MNPSENDQQNSLHGWLQQCKTCGATSAYDQFRKNCEKCNTDDWAIFFKCPECAAKTEYGKTHCSGCHKEISYLISAPYIAPQKPTERKMSKKRILRFIIVFLIFSGLIYAATLNIFIAIALGIAMGLFCMFL